MNFEENFENMFGSLSSEKERREREKKQKIQSLMTVEINYFKRDSISFVTIFDAICKMWKQS